MHLVFSEIKPVLDFQFCAYLFIAVHVVPVRNGLAVVVYTVEYDMHMWVFPVLMAHDDVLRIGDFHFTHIFLRKLYLLLVGQLGLIHFLIA